MVGHKLTVSLLCVAALAMVAMPAAADCLKCRIKSYVRALNEHDVDKAASFFGAEVVFRTPRSTSTLEADAIRAMLGWDAATGASVATADLEWDGGDTVTCTVTERNEFYRLLGIAEQSYGATFHFEGDLIREMTLEPVSADAPSLEQAMQPFLDWASANHGLVLKEIYPDGSMAVSADSARTWLELLREWRAG